MKIRNLLTQSRPDWGIAALLGLLLAALALFPADTTAQSPSTPRNSVFS